VKRSLRRLRTAGASADAALTLVLLLPLRVYRRLISPALPARCKYYPSCSSYAEQAVRELGVVRGLILAAWRLARCNPWSHGGVDEVADRTLFRHHPAGPEHRDQAPRTHDLGAPA
jgi:putative membrane protein insertion efficiency factor